jgi:hypothetical protein
MNRRAFQAFTCLMWLALPLTALRYWLAWDRLPLRMATHFDINWKPNGWMTREVSLRFALGITAFLLVVFTGVMSAIQKRKVSGTFSWVLLGFFYLILGIAYFANSSVLEYNLNGQRIVLGPVMALVPLAIIALIAVYVGAERGERLPAHDWIATETHASPLLAVVFLAPLVFEMWIFAAVPLGVVRAAGALMCLVFFVLAAFAWSGFQYHFGPLGVEISTLGFRLRSIPLGHIESYAVEPWTLLRGYGIRGVGDTRAYVWCNQVVHIKTTHGDVFLGHDNPERIVRDLDSITHNKQSQVSQRPRE